MGWSRREVASADTKRTIMWDDGRSYAFAYNSSLDMIIEQ